MGLPAHIRRIHQHRSTLNILHRLGDAAAVLVGLRVAAALRQLPLEESHWLAAAAAVVLLTFAAEITALYRSWRGIPVDRELAATALTLAAAMLLLVAAGYATGHAAGFSRLMLGYWSVAALLLAAAARLAMRWCAGWLRAQGYNTRRFAIVGVNDLAQQLARNIEAAPEMGLVLAGFFDDRPTERTGELPDDIGRRLGNLSDLVEQARAGQVDLIYITFPMRAEERIRGVLAALGDTTASVYIVPDIFVFELLHSRWTSIGGLPAVSIFESPFYGIDGLAKRLLDLAVGSVLLALLALPMALIALAIKLTSRGPVFFRQQRYGLDGRAIRVWKFRTMRTCEAGDRAVQATRNDPRITPVGAVLRKTSLDELPQLFNVVGGTMSLVGPRPHPTALDESFRRRIAGYMLRSKVKPGITGLAQVHGFRGETDTLDKMEGRVRYDHQYIRDWSLLLDLEILLRTAWVVLARTNAY